LQERHYIEQIGSKSTFLTSIWETVGSNFEEDMDIQSADENSRTVRKIVSRRFLPQFPHFTIHSIVRILGALFLELMVLALNGLVCFFYHGGSGIEFF
jgi:hypothetical protein